MDELSLPWWNGVRLTVQHSLIATGKLTRRSLVPKKSHSSEPPARGGGYENCVFYNTAQLIEGRSARDQPKQPPAKKCLKDHADSEKFGKQTKIFLR